MIRHRKWIGGRLMQNIALQDSNRCEDCPIRHRAVCSTCSSDELMMLEDMKFYRSYPAGKQIVWRGDELSFVASVVRGVASLSTQLEDGRKQMVGLLLPSDFFGRPGREKALFDMTAATDLLLCCFHRKPFEMMMETTPHVGQRLLSMTLDELDSARDWMVLLGRKQARERVASMLGLLASRAETGPDGLIDLPLTREALADYLGLTFETVSRQFSQLRRDGIIALDGGRQFRVLDARALQVASGGDSVEDAEQI